MTPIEFKAWFDGFIEAIDKQPTQKQWARIKERVAEIDGKPITERVYVDRYWSPYVSNGPTWINPNYRSGYVGGISVSNTTSSTPALNSSVAMNALGKADAASLN